MSCGRRSAALLMLILSAPAESIRSTSESSLMPPPTVNGMSVSAATFCTMSVKVLRPSWLAVMSRKTSSSAPWLLYSLPSSTGSPACRSCRKFVPLTVCPSFTSRQGMIRFANMWPPLNLPEGRLSCYLNFLFSQFLSSLRRRLCRRRRRGCLPVRGQGCRLCLPLRRWL